MVYSKKLLSFSLPSKFNGTVKWLWHAIVFNVHIIKSQYQLGKELHVLFLARRWIVNYQTTLCTPLHPPTPPPLISFVVSGEIWHGFGLGVWSNLYNGVYLCFQINKIFFSCIVSCDNLTGMPHRWVVWLCAGGGKFLKSDQAAFYIFEGNI